jgi:hypothetical protein
VREDQDRERHTDDGTQRERRNERQRGDRHKVDSSSIHISFVFQCRRSADTHSLCRSRHSSSHFAQRDAQAARGQWRLQVTASCMKSFLLSKHNSVTDLWMRRMEGRNRRDGGKGETESD